MDTYEVTPPGRQTLRAGDRLDRRQFLRRMGPVGNVTGLSLLSVGLGTKRLELFRDAVPGLSRLGVFRNPALPDNEADFRETQSGARTLGMEVLALEVRVADDLQEAFATATE